jgi:hypothetical protein
VLEAVRDDTGVVNAGLLIESFEGVVLTDDDGKVAGGVKKDLIAAYTKD